ncbi:MAG: conjugal transfer protein TrbL [Deinococcus sp.]
MPAACSEGRVLPALLLLIAGSALAAGGASPINVDAFVPRADEWISSTFSLIKEFRVFGGMRLIGTTLVFASFVLGFVKHWPARNLAAILRSLALSVLAVTLINDATRNAGVIGSLYTLPMTVWQKAYVASTRAVKPRLDSGVIQDTRDLAVTMNSFVSNAMLSVNAMGAFDGSQVVGSDPTAAASGAAEGAITSVTARTADETRVLQSVGWIYQLGYLLLLGFFMAFAGVIYFSAMTVVFGMLALPVALAFWAGGNGGGVRLIVTSWLTAILTATLAPPIMMVATNMALKQPTAYIRGQIDPLNTQARATMGQYAATYASCAAAYQSDWMLAGTATELCGVSGNLSLLASSFGSAVMKIIVGLGIMVISMIVSLGVGAALIRAVPNILGGLLGGGVGSGGPDIGVARAAGGLQQAARAMTTALAGGGAARAGTMKGAVDGGIAGGRAATMAGVAGGRAASAVGGAAASLARGGADAMHDNAAVRDAAARRNEQTKVANAARQVIGMPPVQGTSQPEVRAQLAAAGALPSQAAAAARGRAGGENAALLGADAGAARQFAAARNAGEQNRAVTRPGYTPRTISDQQAYQSLKTAGTLPSQAGGRAATGGVRTAGGSLGGMGQPGNARAAPGKAYQDVEDDSNVRGTMPTAGSEPRDLSGISTRSVRKKVE